MSDEAPRRSGRPWAVVALLAVHVALLIDGARRDGVTFDEPPFLSGAVACWQGDYRLSPDGGALPQRLEGLPLHLAGLRIPPEGDDWRTSDAYDLGRNLLYRSDLDPAGILLLGRIPIACVSVLLGLLVHGLALRLLGPGSALLSLTLYALSPAFLAHGHLATADVTSCLTLTLATWLAARCLERLTWASLVLSCLATGAAFCAKFSAVLLVPIVLLVVLGRVIAGAPSLVLIGRRREIRGPLEALALAGALLLAHAGVSVAAVWAIHGFRYAAFREPDATASLKDGGWAGWSREDAIGRGISLARAHRVLPEAWLFGLQYTTANASGRRAYALGKYGTTGWWWYFPLTLGLKTPLSTLALTALAAVAFVGAWRRRRRLTRAREDEPEPRAAWARSAAGADVLALLPLLALVLVYGSVAVASHLNVGLRHLLPVLPAALVVAGAAWRLAEGASALRPLLVALTALAAIEGASGHPDHLAWMNAAAGPASHRWHLLADSSLDWGQGLPALREALPGLRLPGETAWLGYFGTADPLAEGIDAEALASGPFRWSRRVETPLHGGLYCVGATSLAQIWSQTCPGPWHEDYERAWQEVRPVARAFFDADVDAREALLARDGRSFWSRVVWRYEELELGRLCATLRRREPDAALAGGAMLVYRLDDGEVERAISGPPAELTTGSRPIPVSIEPLRPAGASPLMP